MSISLESLKEVPTRLAAALSPEKAGAIRAAVEGGLINAIATDAPTARRCSGASDGGRRPSHAPFATSHFGSNQRSAGPS